VKNRTIRIVKVIELFSMSTEVHSKLLKLLTWKDINHQ